MARKVILYISMSLDSYVATKDDDLSFLETVQTEGEDYGYAAFTSTVDTYIIGRKTYDVVTRLLDDKFPQADQFDCYVITRQNIPNQKNITFYNGDVEALLQTLKSQPGKNIYCDGGPQIVKLLLDKNLIDELTISIIPVLLGDGKKLFKNGIPYQHLHHQETKTFPSGLVQFSYTTQSNQ